jgi:hypothetical protein
MHRCGKPTLGAIITSGYRTKLLDAASAEDRNLNFLPKPVESRKLASAVRERPDFFRRK